MKERSSEAASSSSSQPSPSVPGKQLSSSSISPAKELGESSSDGSGAAQGSLDIDRRGEYAVLCRWTIKKFAYIKAAELCSKHFDVGGYHCRILCFPMGNSQSLPAYISIYLHIMDFHGTTSSHWDCFSSFRLSILNHLDDSLTIHKDSYDRFSSKNKPLGWCKFTLRSSILDPKLGFLLDDDSLVITADILILNESVTSTSDHNNDEQLSEPRTDVSSGKFTWKIHNFSLFKEKIKSQQITSRIFHAGRCKLRMRVFQSLVKDEEYLSISLDSKEMKNSVLCLYRISVVNQKLGTGCIHRDAFGRFSMDSKHGKMSYGWKDFIKMSEFVSSEAGYLKDDMAVFSAWFQVITEGCWFSKRMFTMADLTMRRDAFSDEQEGTFSWVIRNFTRMKYLLKKKKLNGLFIFSRTFQIGHAICRIVVYPRGPSQSPTHLSMFLQAKPPKGTNGWSCFASLTLSVVNHKLDDGSVTMVAETRYSEDRRRIGMYNFVALEALFDEGIGFLVHDTVEFSAEVLVLKETYIVKDLNDIESDDSAERSSLTWKVENFLAFKKLIETKKIFSKFVKISRCEFRIGVFESFGFICMYLESNQSERDDADNNHWLRYKMGILNQKDLANSVWKKSSICTKTWENTVLQFMEVSDMFEADLGFLVDDTAVFVCEILDSKASADEEDKFLDFISRAGYQLSYDGEDHSQPQVTIQIKPVMDDDAISRFLSELRVYLDDHTKLKRLLVPIKLCGTDECSTTLMNLLMRSNVLQHAIIDMLLDVMVQPSENWREQSEELLGLIISSLKAVGEEVPNDCPEARTQSHSSRKIVLALDRAPKHLLPDLVNLVPKLVAPSEHPQAAQELLERLQKPEADPALHIPVFECLSQMESDSEVMEGILFLSFEVLRYTNGYNLVAAIDFVFETASQCHHLYEAVRLVRERLKQLGPRVSHCVLHYLSATVRSREDIAKLLLEDIRFDDDSTGRDSTTMTLSEPLANRYFSDLCIVLDMSSLSSLAVEASRTLETVVSRGKIAPRSLAAVFTYVAVAGGARFKTVLDLAETLSHSEHLSVKVFVTILYTLLFRGFTDESSRKLTVKALVDRFISCESDVNFDFLILLICEEQAARPVLTLLKEVVEHSKNDRAALRQELSAKEEELVRIREEQKIEILNLANEKSDLTEKLNESEAAIARLEAEKDRVGREKKEISEQMRRVESRLKWIRSEHDDEMTKASSEKKTVLDRLHETEAQLSQLKTRKRDELKRVEMEKDEVAERLKKAETGRTRLEEECKRFDAEREIHEEERKSLEDEVRRLRQMIGTVEDEKREKDDQIAEYEAYINEMQPILQAFQRVEMEKKELGERVMEAEGGRLRLEEENRRMREMVRTMEEEKREKEEQIGYYGAHTGRMESLLQAFQQRVHSLESSLREERLRRGSLEGASLESLSMGELDIIGREYEERLRLIRVHRQRYGNMIPLGQALGSSPGPSQLPSATMHNDNSSRRHSFGAIGPRSRGHHYN